MSTPDTPFYPMTHDDAVRLALALEALNPGPAGSAKQGFVGPAAYFANGLILAATQSVNGLMSAADKAKLDTPETIIFPTGRSLLNNAGFHNSIFRGKYLGTSLTAAQSAQIQAGTFDDLFIGDYWTINGVNWRIADFDPYYRCGDNMSLGHHIAVVPDSNLYSTVWNDSNTTAGGYVASKIRENIKSSTNGSAEGAQQKVIAAFGSSHVLSYRALYPTTYDSSGNATGWAWTDARVELMNENEVYGAQVWSVGGKGHEVGISKRQLSLFRLAPQFVNVRAYWWLRSVDSATYAAFVDYNGYANNHGASTSLGVRPLSLIA